MKLWISDPSFRFEAENIARLFLEDVQVQEGAPDDDCLTVHVAQEADAWQVLCRLPAQETGGALCAAAPKASAHRTVELCMGRALYTLLSDFTGIRPPWGVLTGIRPVKLVRELTEKLGDRDAVKRYLQEECFVSQEKIELALRAASHETEIVRLSRSESASLYVSIPFCPSRCQYCSFVSRTVERAGKLVEEYVTLLSRELRDAAQRVRALGLRLETVYFGGGTPTVLTEQQLETLLSTVEAAFDLSAVREYTVEGGRPDTITRGKLECMRRHGVTRLSVNPQTMNDEVLAAVGRRHTAQQIVQAYQLAREVGIREVNMDLIAGLPTDTAESFFASVDAVLALAPENITIHTMCVKRSSFVREHHIALPPAAQVEQMLSYGYAQLEAAGYLPYYLYRQKNTIANAENTGWCKPGTEGLYNVYIMDETHTIIACGAGAVTKLRQPGGGRIERVFNYKYPYEYNKRFDEMIKRKERVGEFYAQYGFTGDAQPAGG